MVSRPDSGVTAGDEAAKVLLQQTCLLTRPRPALNQSRPTTAQKVRIFGFLAVKVVRHILGTELRGTYGRFHLYEDPVRTKQLSLGW
jgi:hypothetical protein